MSKIAIIRIRGHIGMKGAIKDTLKMLRLYKANTCIIIDNTQPNVGMVEKVKEQVTWGEITPETFKLLLTKRGKTVGKKPLTEEYLKNSIKITTDDFIKEFFESKKALRDIPGFKPFFKLTPPKGGYERKGVKQPFSLGGAIGYRKDKINDLIRRML